MRRAVGSSSRTRRPPSATAGGCWARTTLPPTGWRGAAEVVPEAAAADPFSPAPLAEAAAAAAAADPFAETVRAAEAPATPAPPEAPVVVNTAARRDAFADARAEAERNRQRVLADLASGADEPLDNGGGAKLPDALAKKLEKREKDRQQRLEQDRQQRDRDREQSAELEGQIAAEEAAAEQYTQEWDPEAADDEEVKEEEAVREQAAYEDLFETLREVVRRPAEEGTPDVVRCPAEELIDYSPVVGGGDGAEAEEATEAAAEQDLLAAAVMSGVEHATDAELGDVTAAEEEAALGTCASSSAATPSRRRTRGCARWSRMTTTTRWCAISRRCWAPRSSTCCRCC